MVRVEMLYRGDDLCGVRMEGHAGGKAGSDIVCAAISSAVYMAANTVTDVCGVNADIQVDDGYFFLVTPTEDKLRAADILEGLRLHLNELQRQYPKRLKVDSVKI